MNKNLGWQYQNSLAAMCTTSAYLSEVEILRLQGLSVWWYERGINRVTISRSLKLEASPLYFLVSCCSRHKPERGNHFMFSEESGLRVMSVID